MDTGSLAKEYVNSLMDKKIDRASRGAYRGGDVESCRTQKSMFHEFWVPELDDKPHVFVHGDLGGSNIIVDDNYNIVK